MNKKTKTRICAAAVATIMTFSLAGCSKDTVSTELEKPSISSEYNKYDKYVKFRMIDGVPTRCYRGSNISITINKETNEIDEYIYNKGSLIYEVYELPTGDMIAYTDTIITAYGLDYLNNIIRNSNVVDFVDIDCYVEGETCKEWYTMEEIKELEPKILESVLKIREAEKQLKKTN